MGIRWKSVLFRGSTGSFDQIATAIQPKLQLTENPINISLLLFQSKNVPEIFSAEIVSFENRDVRYHSPSQDILTLIPDVEEKIAQLFLEHVFKWRFEFYLAELLSRNGSDVTLVEYIDSTCSSGYFHLNAGKIERAEFYGSNGSDLFLSFKDRKPEFSRRDIASFANGFGEPLAQGLGQFFAKPADVDFLFAEFYSRPAVRYRLMEKKALLNPVRIE